MQFYKMKQNRQIKESKISQCVSCYKTFSVWRDVLDAIALIVLYSRIWPRFIFVKSINQTHDSNYDWISQRTKDVLLFHYFRYFHITFSDSSVHVLHKRGLIYVADCFWLWEINPGKYLICFNLVNLFMRFYPVYVKGQAEFRAPSKT